MLLHYTNKKRSMRCPCAGGTAHGGPPSRPQCKFLCHDSRWLLGIHPSSLHSHQQKGEGVGEACTPNTLKVTFSEAVRGSSTYISLIRIWLPYLERRLGNESVPPRHLSSWQFICVGSGGMDMEEPLTVSASTCSSQKVPVFKFDNVP